MRVEWQKGENDGYVRWFWHNKLLFEITSDTLKSRPGPVDTIPDIPFEPMYLILNMDISPRWGWNGCNPHDPCMKEAGICNNINQLSCYDCSDPNCLQCPRFTSWLQDFCQDVNPDNAAIYKIDYIRSYQDPQDPSHTVGCDPPDYPTRDYITQNWQAYTFATWKDDAPLKIVMHGGGDCSSHSDCVPKMSSDQLVNSSCVSGKCHCPNDWTGPQCHSPCVGDYAFCQNDPDDDGRNMSSWAWILLLCAVSMVGLVFLYLICLCLSDNCWESDFC